MVGLRGSRLNHNCRPNADNVYDETARVQVIFAHRDIQPGEEICLNYYNFASMDSDRPTAKMEPEAEFRYVEQFLFKKWGIVCPDDCYCKCPKNRELVIEGRRIYGQMEDLLGKCRTEDALALGGRLLDIHRSLDVSRPELANAHHYLLNIALMKRKTLPMVDQHLQAIDEINKIGCPYSERCSKEIEELKKHPEKNPHYLKADELIESLMKRFV